MGADLHILGSFGYKSNPFAVVFTTPTAVYTRFIHLGRTSKSLLIVPIIRPLEFLMALIAFNAKMFLIGDALQTFVADLPGKNVYSWIDYLVTSCESVTKDVFIDNGSPRLHRSLGKCILAPLDPLSTT